MWWLLKLFLVGELLCCLNSHSIDSNKMRLSVFINYKLCSYFLNNTLVIFFNKLDQVLNNTEKLFVQKCIKKFIPLKILSFISQSLRLWINVPKLIDWKLNRRYGSNVGGFERNNFMTFTFNDMIFSYRDYFITLLYSGLIIYFLSDNFPFLIKSMLNIPILTQKIYKFR